MITAINKIYNEKYEAPSKASHGSNKYSDELKEKIFKDLKTMTYRQVANKYSLTVKVIGNLVSHRNAMRRNKTQ